MPRMLLIVAWMAAFLTTAAIAQAPPSYGFDWATITHAGNRAATQEEAPYLFPPYHTPELHVGSVGYEYRIARTELTVEQHFEFVQAYAPFWKGNPGASEFIGVWISWTGSGYEIDPGYEKKATSMGWRTAARYCNWLHNGKAGDQWAFEDGAYDTSTFGTNPDGTITDQPTRHPDARFWIPTQDEWVKAAHYDPNRYGEGLEGYWLYPDAGQEPLISGYPWEGGETDAGIEIKPGYTYLDVGSYPDVRSPWGLLDLSGGGRSGARTCPTTASNGSGKARPCSSRRQTIGTVWTFTLSQHQPLRIPFASQARYRAYPLWPCSVHFLPHFTDEGARDDSLHSFALGGGSCYRFDASTRDGHGLHHERRRQLERDPTWQR